jgi:DNA-binding GntR family transcriptional regulator
MSPRSSAPRALPAAGHAPGRSPGVRAQRLLPTSRRQQVADVLREEIVTGVRAPGEQLKQDEIAHDLGLSPGPVREALRQLESEGLVEHFPNRGVFVTEIGRGDLVDLLLPVRLAIERYAVPRGLERIRASHLGELRDMVGRMEQSAREENLAAINELDVRFHELTVRAAGAPQALQLWNTVQPRIRAQIYRLAPRHRDLQEIVTEHRDLLAALAGSSEDQVRAAIQEHIIGTARRLLG